MPIVYLNWITRQMIQAEPEARFVFGDNVARIGMGGQAKDMRGEPNSIGVATKWRSGMTERDFFVEGDERARSIMFDDLSKVHAALNENRAVYVPEAGLGTGYSQLPQRAPRLYEELFWFFERSSPQGCPWPK